MRRRHQGRQENDHTRSTPLTFTLSSAAFMLLVLATNICGTVDGFAINRRQCHACASRSSRSLASCVSSSPIVSTGRPIAQRRRAININSVTSTVTTRAAAAKSSGDETPTPSRSAKAWRSHLPLPRPHERALFALYVLAGLASSILLPSSFKGGYHISTGTYNQIEAAICLIWSSMVLAISFLEAWVKFKAPFLRKYVAVDVGRHVFAALNAAELGLAASFWIGRFITFQSIMSSRRYALRNPLLPSLATAALLFEVLFVAPKLYLRAKTQIVKGFESASEDELSTEEKSVLQDLAEEVKDQKQLPSPKWHFVYVLLELVKVLWLNIFASKLWR